jgi:hypothetical protein
MLKKLNDGPKKLTLGTKKEQRQQDAATQTSFLDKARKQDQDEKKAKQDAQKREEEAARIASQRAELEAAKTLEREKAKLAKESEKLAKKQQKAEKAVKVPSSSPKKKLFLPAAAAVLLVGAIGFMTLQSQSDGGNQSAGNTEVVQKYSWSALIAGESEAKTGDGTTFEVFVCDQYVLAPSLQIESLSPRPTDAGALRAKVLKGDARCGADFDTIVLTGTEAEQSGSVNYFVSGRTSSGFEFRYDFSVTIIAN